MVTGNQDMKASVFIHCPATKKESKKGEKKNMFGRKVQSLCFVWARGLLDADTDTTSVCCRLMQNVPSASPAFAFLYYCCFVKRLGLSRDVGFSTNLSPDMLLYFIYRKQGTSCTNL